MAVTGIGGFFIRARDPDALQAWYRDHLGFPTGRYGKWEQQAGTSVFQPVGPDSDIVPAGRQWRLNLRVSDLAGLVARLRAAGVEVEENPDWNMPSIGNFARLHDPEGNPLELWEPVAA